MKRTDMITYDHGDAYRVYEEEGRLYYRAHGTICGTWPEYCEKGDPISTWKRKNAEGKK